ncbi:universal stress protein [Ancylobacter mangrovi]|uniref:universal stress protein n=1 Tax=Ancylobacter mangrovi TaxID=2972472 RepID=UPI002163DC82|nr:universal stress protein [Ancylobacter mangrovi]MCS0502860.1 universal stress protein [Ancylobacter mangrovi]
MYRHILIPVDGSPLSMTAMETSMAFARDAGAKVTALMVVEPFHLFTMSPEQIEATREEYERLSRAQADHCLAAAAREAERFGVPCEVVQLESDDPYLGIIDTATQRGCDLIAMASHGRRGIAALMLGSVTLKVLTHSSIPVLVYR